MINNSVYVIAEAGVNHNGSLDLALKLVEAAKDAGADAVKFQSFKAEQLVSQTAKKAGYQQSQTDSDESQFEMLRRLEVSENDHEQIINHCNKLGIEFLSSPFDLPSLELLVKRFQLEKLKLGSGEITNAPLLFEIGRSRCPLILSTGMSTLDEVREALGVLAFGYLASSEVPTIERFKEAFSSSAGQALLREKLTLLHCTTEYPAPYTDINLKAMDSLENEFGFPVGYSDHSEGLAITLAAVARGASVIEKHFTLDRNLPGPDHKASLEPDGLKLMVEGIRQIEAGLGDGVKRLMPSELNNRDVARKSLVTQKPVKKGEVFNDANLVVKRPGTGVAPIHYWRWLGRVADRDYEADEVVVE